MLPVWEVMTNSNQHTMRCVSIAEFFKEDIGEIYSELFLKILDDQHERGHLPYKICEIKNYIEKQMLDEIARFYGKNIAEQIK